MSFLTLYLIAFAVMLALVILAIRGRLINWFYAVCVLADVLLDMAAQLFIDLDKVLKYIRRIFRRRVRLDEHERELS
jgi:hypothetical protein